MHVEYVKNGITTSIVVRFLFYLLEKQTIKAKKSTEVWAWAKKELSGVLSVVAYTLLVTVFLLKEIWVKERNSEWGEHIITQFYLLAMQEQISYKLDRVHTLHAKW